MLTQIWYQSEAIRFGGGFFFHENSSLRQKICSDSLFFSTITVPTKHATRDKRLQVHTLAGMEMAVKDIAAKMSFTTDRVYYILKCPVSPRKRKGRPPIFDEAKRQRLVEFVVQLPENRQMAYFQLPLHVSHHAYERTIRKALSTEGHHQRVARRKPYLSAVNRAKRLLFAQCYKDQDIEDWHAIFWTDESSMQCLGNFLIF